MKKKILLIPAMLMALASLVACGDKTEKPPVSNKVEGKTIYIAANGSATGDGTKETPYDVYTAFPLLSKGDTLKVLPGNYDMPERIFITLEQSGDAYNYITVENESTTEPAVFNFSKMAFLGTNRGVTLNADYWHFNNIEIVGAGDNGMYIGGSHNIIENCLFHENRDTGLQLGRADGGYASLDLWPSNNLIKNCTSYNNYDDETFGENADGFAAKLTVGFGNVFDGCIAYRNSDDGWDLFAKPDSGNIGTVILYNCVSFENGFLLNKTNEAGVERFITRDGDGIGFKLGGSTMKGDVILNNCVAFNNRLHGIGDNSNPGVISVNNCTCFNNCASLDENGAIIVPTGEETVKYTLNDSESSNFDIARSSASYNNYSNILSYVNNKTAKPDRYLGSMKNSIVFAGGTVYRRVENIMDASSLELKKAGEEYKGMSDSVFKSLTGINGLNNRNIYKDLRNEDGSIQLGDFLSLADETLKATGIGADLTKTKYEDYEHYVLQAPTEEMTADEIKVLSAYDALQLNCNPEAVYQNMLAPVSVNGCSISWISSDPKTVVVNEKVTESLSQSKEIVLSVNRSKTEDKKVTLTAQIQWNQAIMVKTFEVTVKKDTPSVGEVYVEGVTDKIILQQYSFFDLPELIVTNASSYAGNRLEEEYYELTTKYYYAVDSLSTFNEIDNVYSSRDGLYRVEYTVTSKTEDNVSKSVSYLIYISNPEKPINIEGDPIVNVTRDGYSVEAAFTNVSGNLYVYHSQNETETAETIKSNGQKIDVTSNTIYETFENENISGYYVHLMIENKKETYTSEIATSEVLFKEINSEKEFFDTITGKTNSSTIYLLTKDLDFTGFNWNNSNKNTFVGLLNGQNHTVRNLDFKPSSGQSMSLFYKVKNGTIMNINFENLSLTGTADYVGIVGQMNGGYIHNVKIKNVNLNAVNRAAVMVARIGSGYNYFSQVSIVNDKDHKLAGGERVAALLGFVQDETSAKELTVDITNCQVISDINGKDYVGGVVGRFDDRQSFMKLTITKTYYAGHITAGTYVGGILAAFNNGVSQIDVEDCVSDFECTYNGAVFTTGLKNCSPIIGRNPASSGTGYSSVVNCYGRYAEYNALYDSTFIFFASNIKSEAFYKNTVKFDLDTIWIFDAETKTIALR